MDNNVSVHVRMFNDRVRAMNQSNGKILTLNAQEARNLHAEIYELMATVSGLSKNTENSIVKTGISMDGGGFK
jgi:hypothetical protein